MRFKIHGTRTANGKPVIVRGDAETLADAIRKVEHHGIRVESATFGDAESAAADVAPPEDAGAEGTPEETLKPSVPPFRTTASPKLVLIGGTCAAVLLVAGLCFALTRGARPAEPTNDQLVTLAAAAPLGPQAPESMPANIVRAVDGSLAPAPGYIWESKPPLAPRVGWRAGLRHPDFAHILSHSEEGRWFADPGYGFVSSADLTVVWHPHTVDRAHPNLITLATEGGWTPRPGFAWVNPDDRNCLDVVWKAGRPHPLHPNVLAGKLPDQWQLRPGYAWVRPGDKDDLAVVWRPGTPHPSAAHVFAGKTEAEWIPMPGYRWVDAEGADSDARVMWVSGRPHATASHVVSGRTEGEWVADSGYRFANSTPGDASVVRLGPSREQTESAAASVAVALLAHAAKQQAGDSIGGFLFSTAMTGIRDSSISDALKELFPHESPAAIAAAARLIALGADGELSYSNWASEIARDALIRSIRASDPSAANAAELANFIGTVLARYRRR